MERKFDGFIWDSAKERRNLEKHGVDFVEAAQVFTDPNRKIFTDAKHSAGEKRYFCVGTVNGRILTVRFLYRGGRIRIFGAGFWRKGRKFYEEKNG